MTPDFFTKSTIVSEYSTNDYTWMIHGQLQLLREFRMNLTIILPDGRTNPEYVKISKEIHRLEDEYMRLYRRKKFNTYPRPAKIPIGDAC